MLTRWKKSHADSAHAAGVTEELRESEDVWKFGRKQWTGNQRRKRRGNATHLASLAFSFEQGRRGNLGSSDDVHDLPDHLTVHHINAAFKASRLGMRNM